MNRRDEYPKQKENVDQLNLQPLSSQFKDSSLRPILLGILSGTLAAIAVIATLKILKVL
ncbi:MAG TPA: hypothetical protein PKD37_07835 [Oligoflexia bacterium]|nr:hypothetical protein [Oligoflexia bacterium]HMP27873.1 hypothetical protein [Oligoflexia bacterium]